MVKYAVLTVAVLAMAATTALAGTAVYTGSNDAVQLGIPTGDDAYGDWNNQGILSMGATPTGYLVDVDVDEWGDFYLPADAETPVATPQEYDVTGQDLVFTATFDADADDKMPGIIINDYDSNDAVELSYDWGAQQFRVDNADNGSWASAAYFPLTHAGPITLQISASGTNMVLQYNIGAGLVTVTTIATPDAANMDGGVMYAMIRSNRDSAGSTAGTSISAVTLTGKGVTTIDQDPPDPEGEGEVEVGETIIASTSLPMIGEALTLTAPEGSAAPYQWYKLDGVEPVAIPGADNATLGFPLIGTANYGAASDTVKFTGSGLAYNENSISFDGGADEYLPKSSGGIQRFSGEDDDWVFEATFTDGGNGGFPEIGVTRGSGGYVEVFVNFYYEYVYAWAGGGVLGSYMAIDGGLPITLRMEATATEIVMSADQGGPITLGNYTRGAGDGDYTPWLYENWGGIYDFEISDMTLTGYGIDSVNPAEGLPPEDVGIYAVTYDDGAKATAWAYYDLSDPFPEGSAVPVASLVGLGLLAGAGLVGGMLRNRKK